MEVNVGLQIPDTRKCIVLRTNYELNLIFDLSFELDFTCKLDNKKTPNYLACIVVFQSKCEAIPKLGQRPTSSDEVWISRKFLPVSVSTCSVNGLDSVGEQVGTGTSASSRSRVIHARLLENNSSTRGSGSWRIRERSRNRRLVLSSVRHVHTTTRLDTINYRRPRWNGRARRRLREEKGGKTKRIVTIYRYRTIKGNRTRERYLSRRESARKHLRARPVSWIHTSSLESIVVLFATSDPCTSSV